MSIIRTPVIPGWSSFDRLGPWRDLLDSAFALSGGSASWNPPLDVHETPEAVIVALELAGWKKENFDISLENDVLKISGERKVETPEGRGESFRSERFFGSFQRSVTLPSSVKSNEASASYVNGVLTVTLPKAEEAKPRKIEVQLN